MTAEDQPVCVAVLAVPETSASMLYASYDLFLAAGRDWGMVVNGSPGPQLMRAHIVAAMSTPFKVGNDILVAPHFTIDEIVSPDIVCVPDLLIPPGDPITGRFEAEVAWLKCCYDAGAMLATACSGALLLAEAGLLDGCEATTHWAYCEALAEGYPASLCARNGRWWSPAKVAGW